MICQMCDPSWLQLGWDGGRCVAAVALSVHICLLVLVIYAAIILVLWQTAPALIIFGFLLSYRAARCLLLTVFEPVLRRSGQTFADVTGLLSALLFYQVPACSLYHVRVSDRPVLPARGEELGCCLPRRPPSYPVYFGLASGAYVRRVQLG